LRGLPRKTGELGTREKVILKGTEVLRKEETKESKLELSTKGADQAKLKYIAFQ
jgi:hypothetical protein